MLPTGIICLWYGAIVDIPDGWVICDGDNGTPDLRNRFIVGAGGAIGVHGTGGNVNHNHAFTGDGHFHSLQAGAGMAENNIWNHVTASENVTGTTDNTNGMPPYHALAYIMKL